ncbi:MAG: GNAT family N-acetyltransferase [Bacteroidota bacterium]
MEAPEIFLVDMEESHASGYAEILSDPATWHFLTDSGPKSEAECLEKIRRNIQSTQEGAARYWSIIREEGFVGFMAIHSLNQEEVAISYGVRPSHRRKGIALAALHEVLAWKGLSGKRISIATHKENEASFNLLQKTGIPYEGIHTTNGGPRHVFKLHIES